MNNRKEFHTRFRLIFYTIRVFNIGERQLWNLNGIAASRYSFPSSLKKSCGRDLCTSGHFFCRKLGLRTKQKQQSVPRSFCSRLAWDTYAYNILIYLSKSRRSRSLVGPEGLTCPASPSIRGPVAAIGYYRSSGTSWSDPENIPAERPGASSARCARRRRPASMTAHSKTAPNVTCSGFRQSR